MTLEVNSVPWNGFKTIFVLSVLFPAFVHSETETNDRDPDPKSFLGAFVKLNDASRSLDHPEFKEVLKTYGSLLIGKDPLGPTGIIGNSFLATSAGSLDRGNYSEKGSNNGYEDVTKNYVTDTSSRRYVLQKADGRAAVSDNKTDCTRDIERLVTNVTNNAWSWPFIDSWGKPGPSILQGRLNFVGSYKQCRSAKAPPLPGESGGGFTGNYCVLGLASKNASAASPMAALMGTAIQIGSCMPDSCSETEITLFVQQALDQLGMSATFNVVPTECRTDEREYTAASIAAIVILSVILAFMVCGTLFDILFVQRPKWATQRLEEERLDPGMDNGFQPRTRYHPIPDEEKTVGTDVDGPNHAPMNGEFRSAGSTLRNGTGPVFLNEAKPLLGKGKMEKNTGSSCCGVLGQVLLAFSVYTNASKVLSTAQPPGSLTAINGIRCLSMSWVVLGHMYVFGLSNVGKMK